MTQQTTKKVSPTPAQAAAKAASVTASAAANKVARTSLAAVESTRNSAENVVKISTNAVKELIANSTDGAHKAREKIFEYGREGAENIAKSADAVSKVMYEAIAISRENVEACIECGNTTANMAQEISSSLFDYSNRAFSEGMEISKDFFSCRTVNDVVELQNRMVRSFIDNFFTESVKLSGIVFEYSNEAMEPVQECIANASERMSKALS